MCGEGGGGGRGAGGANRKQKIPISFSFVFGENEAPQIHFLNSFFWDFMFQLKLFWYLVTKDSELSNNYSGDLNTKLRNSGLVQYSNGLNKCLIWVMI